MFTPAERDAVREAVVEAARSDPRISGGALTGSAARGAQDAWSDVDLAFGVRQGIALDSVLADFAKLMYGRFEARHHVDVQAGNWMYRVFLLPSTLQVDVAVAPEAEFGARAPSFRLLFGGAVELPLSSPRADSMVGYGWLYALHVRSSLERGRPWTAEYMLANLRNQVLALACLRHGLPVAEAKAVDRLPPEVTRPVEDSLVGSVRPDEVWRGFRVAIKTLVEETRLVDRTLADRIEPALQEMTRPLQH